MYLWHLILARASTVFDIVRLDVKVKVLWSIGQSDTKEGVSYWS